MKDKKSYTTLSLFSGGLDSILAAKIVQQQGIKVIPICFESPFFDCKKAEKSAEMLGLKLQIRELEEEYLNIIKSPKYSYGKNLNPCIDCHAYMFNKLGDMLKEYNADFMISGEVLGQRPKSQSIAGLNSVDKLCEYKDLIIRPLSQKLLQDTKPIREGWINKEELYDIQGKSRKIQIELAKEFKITNYPSPAGGCLLTDEGYCKRLQDLISYDMFSLKYIKFLNVGRHFRISENTKLILGRKKSDNEKLNNLITDDLLTLKAERFPGPLGVINCKQELNIDEIKLSAQILLRYITKIRDRSNVKISIGKTYYKIIEAKKLAEGLEKKYLIL
ncbi:MAG: DUF814 domain-containing protein [Candidatus Cloacimonadota bacterium]|nr:DUF814 domain-containing protein [Candidatus Cloacimonadota bacterium]